MKKFGLLLLIACAVSGPGVSAFAYDYESQDRSEYSRVAWHGSLASDINHLNRMVGHVRWQLSRRPGNSSVRRDFAQIRREVDRVNWQYKSGHSDRQQLRHEIERIHNRLHDLEVRLQVRRIDYYNWR